MNKLNILIDSNFLANRTLFGGFGNGKTDVILDEKEEQDAFLKKIYTDTSYAIKEFRDFGINKVVVCSDSGSWRKTYTNKKNQELLEKIKETTDEEELKKLNEELKEKTYKGNRSLDKTKIDWDAFFRIKTQYEESLSELGMFYSKIPGLEGDDLIALWSNYFFKKGECVLIISSDGDLNQLLKHNTKNNNFVFQYNPVNNIRSFAYHKETLDYIENYNIYNHNTDVDFWDKSLEDIYNIPQMLSNKAEKLKVKIKSVTPNYSIYSKVISGDKKDNIPTVIKGYGPKTQQKLFSNFPDKQELLENINYGSPNLEFIIDSISNSNKVKKLKFTRNSIKEKIYENAKLLILNENFIPKELKEEWEKTVDSIKDSNITSIVFEPNKMLKKLCIDPVNKKYTPKKVKGIKNIEYLISKIDK